MALIPPDIGLRLRLQNELLPQPVTPLQEIPADLPDLKAGQAFSARIQEVLPENTYRALVAGKSITLSLPESVKAGDLLELVVVDRTPRTIIAQLAAQGSSAGPAAGVAYPHATLSQAAQLVSTLLPAEGEAPAAAPLNRGEPLLAQPPRNGAELAPILSKAVTESGLFYESHQAAWVAGKLPLANLLQEPQGMFSQPQARIAAQAEKLVLLSSAPPQQPATSAQASSAGTPPAAGQSPATSAQGVATEPGTTEPGKLPAAVPAPQPPVPGAAAPQPASAGNLPPLPGNPKEPQPAQQPATQPPASAVASHGEIENAKAQAAAPPPMTAASIPEELRPLVQQQLDSAGTQRLIWHGEVWPGQSMQWEIEWEDRGGSSADPGDVERWTTILKLTTPRLGELQAGLRLRTDGVRIALTTSDPNAAADLRNGATQLEQALASAGVPMRGFTVKHLEMPDQPTAGAGDG